MRLIAILAATLCATAARADCADDINRALPLARAIANAPGRNAVLEEIERARISRHEGDEPGCKEQMQEVFEVLTPPKATAAAAQRK